MNADGRRWGRAELSGQVDEWTPGRTGGSRTGSDLRGYPLVRSSIRPFSFVGSHRRLSAFIGGFTSLVIASTASVSAQGQGEEALKAFERIYGVRPGEAVRWIPPPFPPERVVFLRERVSQSAKPESSLVLRWRGERLMPWAFTEEFLTLGQACDMLLLLYPQEMEGDPDLLKTLLPRGDFVVRDDAAVTQVAAGLQRLCRTEFQLAARIFFEEQERDAVLVRGKFEPTPATVDPNRSLQIAVPRHRSEAVTGSSSGDLGTFLKWVGRYLDRPVLSQVENAPRRLRWEQRGQSPFRAGSQPEAGDLDTMLKLLAEQTGLTYQTERRKVPILRVVREAGGASN